MPTENVRAALAAVESGNAEAGIVYKTDSAISKAREGRLCSSGCGRAENILSDGRDQGVEKFAQAEKFVAYLKSGAVPSLSFANTALSFRPDFRRWTRISGILSPLLSEWPCWPP